MEVPGMGVETENNNAKWNPGSISEESLYEAKTNISLWYREKGDVYL